MEYLVYRTAPNSLDFVSSTVQSGDTPEEACRSALRVFADNPMYAPGTRLIAVAAGARNFGNQHRIPVFKVVAATPTLQRVVA